MRRWPSATGSSTGGRARTIRWVQAARSGKQNIAEGSQTSATSKKSELRLTEVARSSLEELLQDYLDFLRQRRLPIWDKEGPQAQAIRSLAYRPDRSYQSYRSYVEEDPPEVAANVMVCLTHQVNYLLDQQLLSLERRLLAEGGFTERLYHARRRHRGGALPWDRTNRTDGTHRTDDPPKPG